MGGSARAARAPARRDRTSGTAPPHALDEGKTATGVRQRTTRSEGRLEPPSPTRPLFACESWSPLTAFSIGELSLPVWIRHRSYSLPILSNSVDGRWPSSLARVLSAAMLEGSEEDADGLGDFEGLDSETACPPSADARDGASSTRANVPAPLAAPSEPLATAVDRKHQRGLDGHGTLLLPQRPGRPYRAEDCHGGKGALRVSVAPLPSRESTHRGAFNRARSNSSPFRQTGSAGWLPTRRPIHS